MKIRKDDELGIRMKSYEHMTIPERFIPFLPIIIRVDGRSFSGFTRGLKEPFDENFSDCMIETTKALVEEANALMGYTQSDEISLLLYEDNIKSQLYFGGRVFKTISSLASTATYVFNNSLLPKYLPEKVGKWARFDCRAFNVPTKDEAVNEFLWRELDATRNSIEGAARSVYSHKDCFLKNCSMLQEMLFQKGVNWNDYPDRFKRGTYIQKRLVEKPFTEEEIEYFPEKHNARKNPDLVIKRHVISVIQMPPILKVVNRVGVFFNGEEPVVLEEKTENNRGVL